MADLTTKNWNRFVDVEALPPSSCHDFRTLIERYLKKADSIRKQSYQSSQKCEPYHPESQATWSWKRRGWKNCNPVHDPQLYPEKCLDFWMDLKMLQAKQRPFKHHFRAWGNAGDSRKVRLTSTTKKPHKPQAKTLQDPELPHSKACQTLHQIPKVFCPRMADEVFLGVLDTRPKYCCTKSYKTKTWKLCLWTICRELVRKRQLCGYMGYFVMPSL